MVYPVHACQGFAAKPMVNGPVTAIPRHLELGHGTSVKESPGRPVCRVMEKAGHIVSLKVRFIGIPDKQLTRLVPHPITVENLVSAQAVFQNFETKRPCLFKNFPLRYGCDIGHRLVTETHQFAKSLAILTIRQTNFMDMDIQQTGHFFCKGSFISREIAVISDGNGG